MLLQAATLVVASALHLTGHVHGRGAPFDGEHAGIAEAIIAVLLAGAAAAMLRAPDRARSIGLAANGLAIAGFLNGLAFTARGGHAPDIAYHLVMLPVFAANLVVLLRSRSDDQAGGDADAALVRRSG